MENSQSGTVIANSSTPQTQPIDPKKSRSKMWVVLVIIAVALMFMVCCGVATFAIVAGASAGLEGVEEINSTLLLDLCESVNSEDSEKYFSQTYAQNNDVDVVVSKAFGGYEDCNELLIGGFFDLMQSGHSFDVNVTPFGTTATYSFQNPDDVLVTLYLIKDGDRWIVTKVTFTEGMR